MAASDMMGDQTAKHGAEKLLEAAKRNGLSPDACCCVCTDGADAARQEGSGYLDGQHALSSESGRERKSVLNTCCIHGKALEENGGMARAAEVLRRRPDVLVDTLRLLWEMIRGPDNRRAPAPRTTTSTCVLAPPPYTSTLPTLSSASSPLVPSLA